MKNKRILIYTLLPLFILSSCTATSNFLSSSSPDDNGFFLSADEYKNAKTIAESKHYKIIQSDSLYYYYIYDENHDIVKSDGSFNREPHIQMINHILKFTLQAGTGIGTQWGFFYDTNSEAFSQIFQCIFDQCNEKVIYGDINNIVVQDIFDYNKYYREITAFKEPFSDMFDPIINAKFTNNGTCIEVTYFTGSNYKEVIEVFDLT